MYPLLFAGHYCYKSGLLRETENEDNHWICSCINKNQMTFFPRDFRSTMCSEPKRYTVISMLNYPIIRWKITIKHSLIFPPRITFWQDVHFSIFKGCNMCFNNLSNDSNYSQISIFFEKLRMWLYFRIVHNVM